MHLLQRLKSGWTTLKYMRVGLGVLILYSSVTTVHIPGMIVGVLFAGVSLFTDGVCCFTSSCSATTYSKKSADLTNIEYEELDSK